MPTPSQVSAAIHHDMAKRIPALIEAARSEERDRILGLCEYFGEQHDAESPEADILRVLADDISSGVDDMFRDPPKPGPHVVGGPCPKPGERTEADYLREDVRALRAERDAAKGQADRYRRLADDQQEALGQQSRELIEARAALKAEQAAHAETCDLLNELSAVRSADLAEARATARLEAIEAAARAAETAEDPITVFRLHDGRVPVLDSAIHDATQRRLCAEAIRALATQAAERTAPDA